MKIFTVLFLLLVLPALAADPTTDVSVSCSWYDVPCVATAVMTWLREAALYIPRVLFADLLAGLLAAFEAIPVPDAVSQAQSGLATFISVAGYAAYAFGLVPGITLIMGALLARFILRRIPLIG